MQTIEKALPTPRQRRRHAQSTARPPKIASTKGSPINQSRWFESTTGRWLSQEMKGVIGRAVLFAALLLPNFAARGAAR